MSHPRDRRERFLIGKRKGWKRAKGMFAGSRWIVTEEASEIIEHHAKRMRDTGKRCSCSMCCNPRRHGEKTMQELKFEEKCLTQ